MEPDARLLALSDLNLAEWLREQARISSPHSIEERDGLLLTASGTRFPASPFNVAMRTRHGHIDAQQVIEQARAFFGARDRGFSVQTRGHADRDLIEACERVGMMSLSGRAPGMVCTQRVTSASLASGVHERIVQADNAQDFVHVCAQAYEQAGLPTAIVHKVLAQSDRWLAPHWHVRVIYESDVPVCAAMLLFSHGIAGVYWVGTLPSARGKGYADAIMRSITNHAFDQRAQAVVLQASKMGEPIYARIGYREITTYPWFLSAAQK